MSMKTAFDGELFVDHRNSPGLPEDVAIRAGYDPFEAKGGKAFTAATVGCAHCGTHVVLNPWRRRNRAWCSKCDRYVCDICDGIRASTGYDHHTAQEVIDKVQTGRWALSGTMHKPELTPILKSGS